MRRRQRLYDTARRKKWSSILLLVLWGLVGGCSEGAKLIQATDGGGVVTYPYKPQSGSLTTQFRSEALHVMQEHCKGGYTIMKEGEAKGRSRMVENQGVAEMVAEHRWGIQFQCK